MQVLGLPLAAMLSRMAGATVYSVDVDSVLQFRPDSRVRRVGALLNLRISVVFDVKVIYHL